jgi:hypothetical protein
LFFFFCVLLVLSVGSVLRERVEACERDEMREMREMRQRGVGEEEERKQCEANRHPRAEATTITCGAWPASVWPASASLHCVWPATATWHPIAFRHWRYVSSHIHIYVCCLRCYVCSPCASASPFSPATCAWLASPFSPGSIAARCEHKTYINTSIYYCCCTLRAGDFF